MTKLELKDYIRNVGDCAFMDDLILERNSVTSEHTHQDFYEIYVVVAGEFLECCNGIEKNVTCRTMHIIKPSDRHYFSTNSKKNVNILRNIVVEKDLFEGTFSNLFEYKKICYTMLNDIEYQSFLKKTDNLKNLSYDNSAYQFILMSIVHSLISSIMLPSINENAPKWLINAYEQMKKPENFTVGLDRLLSISDKSQEYVSRAFRKYYLVKPTEYINGLRINYASYLLDSTDKRVLEIIYECGFGSVSYFNRMFYERYDQTPRQYRSRKKIL